MSIVQAITMVLAGFIAIFAASIGQKHETIAAVFTLGGALWLGAVACSLEAELKYGGCALRSLAVSILGLFVLLLALGTSFGFFAAIFYLLDNPITGNLLLMPGTLSQWLSQILITLIWVPLFWVANRLSEDWIFGMWGAMMSLFALVPIGLCGSFSYLLLTGVFNLPIEGTTSIVYFVLVALLYGWAVPLAIHFLDY